MSYSKDNPFNDLPLLLPPTNRWETITVYKKLAEARAALAELKGRLPVIPNPLMLINTLVLQEAKDSSTIENVVTTNDKLYKAISSSQATVDAPTKEVLRYREAVWQAFTSIRTPHDFSQDLLVTIFRAITEKKEGIRNEQVYIGNSLGVVYTPPEPGKHLEEKLQNWFDIALNDHSLDPLIKMSLLHYQFEAIHPFTDGNGRTGRILNVLYLCVEQFLELPVLYLSRFILQHKNDYYSFLRDVTEKGAWEAWVLFMLEAIRDTSVFTLTTVNTIYNLYSETVTKVKKEAKDIYSHELINIIFSQPYCSIGRLVKERVASRNTASKYLKRLEELGILQAEQVGTEVLYKNLLLYAIFTS